MGLLQKIFGRWLKKKKRTTPYETTNGYGYFFKNVKSKQDSDTVQAAIHVIALHGSKLQLIHNHKGKKNTYLSKLLKWFPNRYMPIQQFLYKWISHTLYNDNGFVYPQYDYYKKRYVEFWVLNPSSWQLMKDEDNDLWIEFTFGIGKKATVPYECVLHLRNYFVDDDIIGGLKNDDMYLENITNYDQSRKSIAHATNVSSKVIGKLILNDSISSEDRDKKIKEFNEFLEKSENKSAVYAEDMNSKLEAIELKPKSAAGQQLDKIKTDILQHIPMSESILKGDYTESQFNAFYETILEPLVLQIHQVMTWGLFTQTEIDNGNEITVNANLLQHASWATKIAVVRLLKDIQGIKIGHIREMFGYDFDAEHDGNKYLQSLNFVQGDKANEYQTGKSDEDEGKEGKEDNDEGNDKD